MSDPYGKWPEINLDQEAARDLNPIRIEIMRLCWLARQPERRYNVPTYLEDAFAEARRELIRWCEYYGKKADVKKILADLFSEASLTSSCVAEDANRKMVILETSPETAKAARAFVFGSEA